MSTDIKVILTPDIDPALLSDTVFPLIKSIEIYPGDPGDDIPIQINSVPDISVIEVYSGTPGKGVPVGGDAGQVLKKSTNGDYVTEWGDVQAAEVAVDAIGAIPAQDAQATLEAIALSKTQGGTAVVVTGEEDNTGITFVNVDIEKAPDASALTDDSLFLIKTPSGHRKVTYAELNVGSGGSGIRGNVTLLSNGSSGTVQGDSYNATISEATPPVVGPGESVIGVQFLVVNTIEVTNSLTGVNKTYIEGDIVQWSGSAWLRIAQAPDNIVQSFNTRIGDVVSQSGDYTAAQVTGAADVSADEVIDGSWEFLNDIKTPSISDESEIILGTDMELNTPNGSNALRLGDAEVVIGGPALPNISVVTAGTVRHTASETYLDSDVTHEGTTLLLPNISGGYILGVLDDRSGIVSQLHEMGVDSVVRYVSTGSPVTEYMQIESSVGEQLIKAYDSDLKFESENALILSGNSVDILSSVGLSHNGFTVLDANNYSTFIDLLNYTQKSENEIITGAWRFDSLLVVTDRDFQLGDIQIRGEGDATFSEKLTNDPVGMYGKQLGVGSNLGLVKTETPLNGIYAEGRIITDDEIRSGGTGHNVVPVGTQLDRPAVPSQGGIRFNTDTGAFEGWDGVSWVDLSGVGALEELKGSVNLADGGNAGTVTGDPFNPTINEGTEPTLSPGDVSAIGYSYIVETDAASTITGALEPFLSGDLVLWSGASWSRIARTGDSPVDSVFGRTGNVIAETGDYTAAQVTNAVSTADANSFEEDNNFEKKVTIGGRVSMEFDTVDEVLRFTFI